MDAYLITNLSDTESLRVVMGIFSPLIGMSKLGFLKKHLPMVAGERCC